MPERFTPLKTISVSPETKRKFKAISSTRRWNLKTTVELVADDYIERHGITPPTKPSTPA